MSLHLAEVSRRVAPGAHAVVVLDGAGWHQQGGRLVVPGNITLLPLPPYAPELNGMENLWEYLRQNHLSHRVWNTYEAIRRRLLRGLECAAPDARDTGLHHQPHLGKGGRQIGPLV